MFRSRVPVLRTYFLSGSEQSSGNIQRWLNTLDPRLRGDDGFFALDDGFLPLLSSPLSSPRRRGSSKVNCGKEIERIVILAQAGIHSSLILMDSRLRGNDGVMKIQSFYESIINGTYYGAIAAEPGL